jgi:hypothetical protein
MVRQAGTESRKQARVKTGRTSKENRKMGKMSDTCRGWRQAPGQMKQIRV